MEKPLIEAHIVPESLYAPMRQKGVPRVYSTEDGSFPKRSQTGIYDTGILCAGCDNRIGIWDDYAQKILLAPLERYGDPAELGRLQAFTIHNVDYTLFKLFFVSLLWRADQSSQQFFQDVNLGSETERARTMILQGDPGEPGDFGVILARYEDILAASTFYNPELVQSDEDGLNYYRFSLGSYVAMIKFDERSVEGSQAPFLLRPGGSLRVGLFEYEKSKIYKDIIQRMKVGEFRLRRRDS